jgi:hypothetical protein
VRIPGPLRDELAELQGKMPTSALAALLTSYERARPEDWIAQLVEVNRELSDEIGRLQAEFAAGDPRRRSA